jgi:predicted nucleic acid-binding protein
MGEYWPGGPLKVDHLAMAAVTIGELLTGILLLAGGRRCQLLLATQNTEHFEHVGVRLIDPWEHWRPPHREQASTHHASAHATCL